LDKLHLAHYHAWSRFEMAGKETAMALAWQQGPLAPRSVGQFLVADPLPERLLFAEPLRRRMRGRLGGRRAAGSEDVVPVHGCAPDPYHRHDIRQASRRLVVRDGSRVIAETRRPLVLYESGFAPRWYVPRDDIDESTLTPAEGQTFCPYKGLASYYDVGQKKRAAWSYVEAWPEVAHVSGFVSFEPDIVDVY